MDFVGLFCWLFLGRFSLVPIFHFDGGFFAAASAKLRVGKRVGMSRRPAQGAGALPALLLQRLGGNSVWGGGWGGAGVGVRWEGGEGGVAL